MILCDAVFKPEYGNTGEAIVYSKIDMSGKKYRKFRAFITRSKYYCTGPWGTIGFRPRPVINKPQATGTCAHRPTHGNE